jgi:hypothetical protein
MWMNCPASITKAEGLVRPSSVYAKEGTAAHKIAEMILTGDLFPPGKITIEGSEFIVGLPMLRALRPYIDLVQKLQSYTKHIHIEAKVRLAGTSYVWGTADCAARDGTVLHIVDLKYGMGVPVSPDSAQLKIYALAAMDTFWPERKINEAILTIVQPRLNPVPQTFYLDTAALHYWARASLMPAVHRIETNDQSEKVGPYCRWCVRKPVCKSFETYKSSLAADIFNDGLDTLNS